MHGYLNCVEMIRNLINRRPKDRVITEATDGQNATQRISTRTRTNTIQLEVQYNEVLINDLHVSKLGEAHDSTITGPCVTQVLGNSAPVHAWIFKLCGNGPKPD